MSIINVKICGITSLADARFCAGGGVDYLGFIQVEDSPRYIKPKDAKEIIDWLAGLTPVGVFQNQSAGEVNQIMQDASFEYAQLHGDESPEFCDAIDFPVIKTIAVRPESTVEELRALMETYAGKVEFYLLDTWIDGQAGGTGKTFDWNIAAELAKDFKLFVAGGISPENVIEVADKVQPFGIDLNSQVEEAPGIKDFDKLGELFDELYDYER